jgi:hypothetical protein
MSAAINCVTAPVEFCKHVADSVRWAFVFDVLQAGDTIASVVSIDIEEVEGETDSSELTVGDAEPNDTAVTGDEGEVWDIGRAVMATVEGGTANVKYAVTIVVTTTNGETLGGKWLVCVQD